MLCMHTYVTHFSSQTCVSLHAGTAGCAAAGSPAMQPFARAPAVA